MSSERPNHLRPVVEGQTELDQANARALSSGLGAKFNPEVVIHFPHADENGLGETLGAKCASYIVQAVDGMCGRGKPFKDRSTYIRHCIGLGFHHHATQWGGGKSTEEAIAMAEIYTMKVQDEGARARVTELDRLWQVREKTPRAAATFDQITKTIAQFEESYPDEAETLRKLVRDYMPAVD